MTTKITSNNIDATIATTAGLTAATAPIDSNAFNIGLLGFKMAVNEGLTVFNLIDGIVDEFNDETGIDEAEGSNDTYCGTSDFYVNSNTPDGGPSTILASAGFTTTSITEPDTSTAGTNPAGGTGTFGSYTVPSCVTSLSVFAWGAGGAGTCSGGGGFTSGTLAVTPSQVLEVVVGEGGFPGAPFLGALGGGGAIATNPTTAEATPAKRGGGLSGIFTNDEGFPALQNNAPKAPQVYLVGAGGGGSGLGTGGAGGGLIGDAGQITTEQTNHFRTGDNEVGAGGGSQTIGGQAATTNSQGASWVQAQSGFFLGGGASGQNHTQAHASGGSGYFGGGGGSSGHSTLGGDVNASAGGGGSSYYGHPQITCGATEEGTAAEGGGTAAPNYVACTNESGEDGYILLSASIPVPATATETTIISNTFSSSTVATSARIVVFEENIDSPTLNTDIIASVSRDGTNFTNATLSDSGYVTGSSGQRILTGQADISGQPSGQSMRWKLQLANNIVKIHGVSLQWS